MKSLIRSFSRFVFLLVALAFSGSLSFADMTFDPDKVEQAWIEWTNTERSSLDRSPISADNRLRSSAISWSQIASDRGYIDHKRSKRSAYYDYRGIESWFATRDIRFKNISRKTFSESIAYGSVKCPKSGDCSDALIQATKGSWKFFMSEKGKKYDPHYRAIVMPQFALMGVGIVLDEKKSKYYLTIHYATDIIEEEETKSKHSSSLLLDDSFDHPISLGSR